MTELTRRMFRRKGEMFVTIVSRTEAGIRLKPGVEQIDGNMVVATKQLQHPLT